MDLSRALAGTSSFQFRVIQKDGKEVVELHGFIDEESILPSFSSYRTDPVILDLSHLKGIDSEGARVWKSFCRNHSGLAFVLRNMPVAFVQNANFIPDFLPKNCLVESAAVKFACEVCDTEKTEFFQKDNHYTVYPGGFGILAGGTSHTHRNCSCGKGKLMMMESVNKYFDFLSQTKAA